MANEGSAHFNFAIWRAFWVLFFVVGATLFGWNTVVFPDIDKVRRYVQSTIQEDITMQTSLYYQIADKNTKALQEFLLSLP